MEALMLRLHKITWKPGATDRHRCAAMYWLWEQDVSWANEYGDTEGWRYERAVWIAAWPR